MLRTINEIEDVRRNENEARVSPGDWRVFNLA